MAELDPKEALFKIELVGDSYVDINPHVKIWKIRKPFICAQMTDNMINDAIAGLSQQEKVAYLQSVFGKDWQEHYQGDM